MKKLIPILFAVCFLNSCASDKPNSKFDGVQIGTITYSYRDMPDQSIEAILDYTVRSGISSVELMGDAVEKYAGRPEGRNVADWRKSVSMDKFKEVKKMFDEKSVKIDILKLGDPRWQDEEIDYAFNVCRTLGAKGITMEVGEETAKRMAPFGEKHKLYVILHNHGQPGNPDFSFDRLLDAGAFIMLNLDVGHYFGATGIHPNEIIKKFHSRIASIHVKDKTAKTAADPDKNRPFGEGDTPLADIFQLIKKEKWPITCDIELEYEIPPGSDAVQEVAKCVEYCRKAIQGK